MSSTRYDLAIVGMGPVGLAAAYEAAKKGNKVLLIEKRTEEQARVRPQVIVMDPLRKKQLLEMITDDDQLNDDDIKFLDSLAFSAEVQMMSLQRFIVNRIKNLNRVAGSAVVDLQYATTLSSVELGKGTGVIKTGETEKPIEFTHLVAADGVGSETLKLVNKSQSTQKIQRATPSGMKHQEKTYHLAAYVTLSRTDEAELSLPAREFTAAFQSNRKKGARSDSHHLYFLRFDKKSYLKSDKKSVKLGFVGEVPTEFKEYNDKIKQREQEIETVKGRDDLSEEERNAAIQELRTIIQALVDERNAVAMQYVKKAIAAKLNVNESDLQIEITDSQKTPGKNKLKILMFSGGSQKADKAAIVENGHGFYLIGDAYFSPNYPVGHGLNDGLEASVKLSELPTRPENPDEMQDYRTQFSKHMAEYNQLLEGNADYARKIMRAIRWLRNAGAIRGQITKILESTVESREKEAKTDLRRGLTSSINKISNKDKIQEYIDFDKFNHHDLLNDLKRGNMDYPIGFLALNPLDKEAVANLSQTNNHLPIIVQVTPADGEPVYYLYGKNRQGEWNYTELNSKKLHLAMQGKDPAQLFTKDLVILPGNDAYLINAEVARPHHYDPPTARINKQIEEWDRFLVRHPEIVKQYRVDIWDNLQKIKTHIDTLGSAEMKNGFAKVYAKYQDKIKEHNDELIAMARKHPNKADAAGYTPLYHALQCGDVATIRTILQLGADPKVAAKGRNIFTRSVIDNPEIARELFNHGVNPFKPFSKSSTASPFTLSLLNAEGVIWPAFLFECLIVSKNPAHPLYKAAHTELSVDTLTELITRMNKLEYSHIAPALPGIDNNRLINEFLARMIPSDEKLEELKAALKDDRPSLILKLKQLCIEQLEALRHDKELMQSSKFKVSSTLTSLFSHHHSANDADKAAKKEKTDEEGNPETHIQSHH